ncbi:hypothetical protein CHUAL_009800 [Chamberlinius hualienensis]
MGRLIFVAIAFCSFWTIVSCFGFNMCVSKKFCTCDDQASVLNCSCAKPLDDSPPENNTRILVNAMNIHKKWSYMEFRQCDLLFLNSFSMSLNPPKVIEIDDIDILQTNTNVFDNVTRGADGESLIVSVKIENTRIFNLSRHFFRLIDAIDEIEFRNVTIGLIESEAFFMMSNVKKLSIIDSTIDRIASNAFKNLSRFGTISIYNSTINTLDSNSIVAQDIGLFSIALSVINDWKNRSIELVNVSKVIIEKSKIRSMESNFLNVLQGAELEFQNNYVYHLKSNALNGFGNARNIAFTSNRIDIIEEQSIDILLIKDADNNNSSQKIEMSRNEFQCNNGLCWMLNEDQSNWEKAALENNKCSGENATLAQFANRLHDICHVDNDKGRSGGGTDIDHNILTKYNTPKPSLNSNSNIIQFNYFAIAIIPFVMFM